MKRRARVRAKTILFGKMKNVRARFAIEDVAEKAVVRTDEDVAACLDCDRSAAGADARIDNSEMNGAGRKIPITREQCKRRGRHRMRRNIVRDVNERYIRMGRKDHALH